MLILKRQDLEQPPGNYAMSTTTLLLIILILLLIGVVPVWPYSRGWDYGPSGIFVLLLVILLIVALTGGL